MPPRHKDTKKKFSFKKNLSVLVSWWPKKQGD